MKNPIKTLAFHIIEKELYTHYGLNINRDQLPKAFGKRLLANYRPMYNCLNIIRETDPSIFEDEERKKTLIDLIQLAEKYDPVGLNWLFFYLSDAKFLNFERLQELVSTMNRFSHDTSQHFMKLLLLLFEGRLLKENLCFYRLTLKKRPQHPGYIYNILLNFPQESITEENYKMLLRQERNWLREATKVSALLKEAGVQGWANIHTSLFTDGCLEKTTLHAIRNRQKLLSGLRQFKLLTQNEIDKIEDCIDQIVNQNEVCPAVAVDFVQERIVDALELSLQNKARFSKQNLRILLENLKVKEVACDHSDACSLTGSYSSEYDSSLSGGTEREERAPSYSDDPPSYASAMRLGSR